MTSVRIRLALLSSCAALAVFAAPAVAQPVWAQKAPPVADPSPGLSAPQEDEAPSGNETPAVQPDTPVLPPPFPTEAPAEATPVKIDTAPLVIPVPAVWAPSPKDEEGRTAYGLYLQGRMLTAGSAAHEGEGVLGAHYLAEVARLTPEQTRVREQAFTAALLVGALEDAARLVPVGEGVPAVIGEAGRLVLAVQTFANGDARAALAPLKGNPIRPPHGRAAVLVQPWIAAAAGDWDMALNAPPAGVTDLFSQVLRYQRAQLLEIHRQYDDAEAEFRSLTADPAAQTPFRMGYAAFLERRGRRDEATAIYDRVIAGGLSDSVVREARDRATSRGRPPAVATFREGAAGALTLASAVTSGDSPEFAAVYLRLALNVSPNDTTRLLLGSTLAQAKLEAPAREMMATVGSENREAYAAARVQIAASLSRQDRDEDALDEFRKAFAATPDDARVAYFLAAQLVQMERYDEALTILNGPDLKTAEQSAEVHFMRGAAYESLNRIPEAEAELWAALQKSPNQPSFLNYLGYLWVDTGTRVAEGADLIARAHAADPDDGNIQDSLGWAQYRQGQYETAVTTLEEAVSNEPANAEINDHLGDAYWQVGRRREAGFQWNRVLTLEPDAERRAGVETKLADGLPEQTPVSATSSQGAEQGAAL